MLSDAPRAKLIDAPEAQSELSRSPEATQRRISELDQSITSLDAKIQREQADLRRLVAARSQQTTFLREIERRQSEPQRAIQIPRTILIVDSVDSNRRFLSTVVEKADHFSMEADSVAKALQMVAKRKIDMIVADIDAAGGGGVQLAKAVRAELGKTRIPIILVAPATDQEHVVLLANKTIQGHIVKPARRRYLIQAMDEHFGGGVLAGP